MKLSTVLTFFFAVSASAARPDAKPSRGRDFNSDVAAPGAAARKLSPYIEPPVTSTTGVPPAPTAGSCYGLGCNSVGSHGVEDCWCDEFCGLPEYDDCCNDYIPSCVSTCDGACTGTASDFDCYCDEQCVEFGDCCFDAPPSCDTVTVSTIPPPLTGGDSCDGSCGLASPDGSCHCDDLCTGYGDCCSDAGTACPALSTCADSCGTIASTPGSSCFCDFLCVELGDCCDDVPEFCPADTGTCADSCGFHSTSADSDCWCDSVCHLPQFDDCCADQSYTCEEDSRRELGTEDFEAAMKAREEHTSTNKDVDNSERRLTAAARRVPITAEQKELRRLAEARREALQVLSAN